MAQQRQRHGGFRFSLPWMAAQSAPRRTPPQTDVESRPTPVERQSPRIAPSQNPNQLPPSPPRAQPSRDTENQNPSLTKASTQSRVINPQPQSSSPSRIGTQSRPTSKTQSPSQPRVPTQPPSPSPSTRKPRPTTQPPSSPHVNSQNRVGPLPNSPSRTISETKPTPPTGPKIQPPTKSISSTPPIQSKEKTNLIGPKPEKNVMEDVKKHKFDGETEKTTKGTEKVQEHNGNTNHSNNPSFTPSTGLKEQNTPHTISVSDDEAHVEKEKVVSELNPTSSTKEYLKTIISNMGDKDPSHVPHQKKTTTSSGFKHGAEGIKDDVSKVVHKMTNEHKKLPLDEAHVSVITLSGENKGATMTLGNETRKKDEKINILRGYKLNSHESNDSTTEGEKSSNEENSSGLGKQKDKEPKACINSNIQNVNNSIMFHGSITERDPGVHFSMSHTYKERVDETKSKEPLEANEAKSSVAVSHKLTYKPLVRRRCLKGLFMESSDSDPENPNKPRRHGCRAACGQKSDENKIDVM